MEKPKTLSGLMSILKDIENDRDKFVYENKTKPVEELRQKLYKQYKPFVDAYDEKIRQVKDEIKIKERELKELREKKFDPALYKWFKTRFSIGINFGYGGASLRYVDPQNRFIIVTSNGGTAGTGTAMGTGAYYYAESEHFVSFPQFGGYFGEGMPHSEYKSSTNALFSISGGVLNQERKSQLIEKGVEYFEKYNLQPFKTEELTDIYAKRKKNG